MCTPRNIHRRKPHLTTPLITLLSDFGLKDPYVAEMKAVILSICPEACIVDISHEIEKFNIRMGAFALASAASYFPNGVIHVAVVDPGVGTKRRPILVETQHAFYIGPDNGLLMLTAQRDGIRSAYHIVNKRYMLPHVSQTFHGRDVFTPAAAHLANGCTPSDFGPEIHDYVIPEFAKPRLTKGELSGEVLHIDDFGNIITNISKEDLGKTRIREGAKLRIKLKGKSMTLRLHSTYGDAATKAPLALIDSQNFFEIAINQDSASEKFKTKAGDTAVILLT